MNDARQTPDIRAVLLGRVGRSNMTETSASGSSRVGAPEPSRQVDEGRGAELRRLRGFNLGAAFYGWLVAVGVGALLTSLLGAAGAAIGLQQGSTASNNAAALTLTGGALLLLSMLIAYFVGGYVAGRLSRFDGAVQGVGVWVLSLLITAALALVGYLAGAKYNVLSQLHLPSIPVQGESLAEGGIIALVVIAALTLLAAILGGIVGHRYHTRVDRALTASDH